MGWTSRRALSKGFTLIELAVVVLILALLSALVVPRLANIQDGIEAKLSLDSVQRLATRARETAISSGRPVGMAYNESDGAFELRQETDEGDGSVVASTVLHPGFSPERFVVANNESNASDWQVNFYGDGTSDGGGLELNEGGVTRSFIIGAKSGLSRWANGGLPASETEIWPAGEYERRG